MRFILSIVVALWASACLAAPVVKISQCQGQYCTHGSGTVVGRLSDKRVVILTCGHGWISSQPVSVLIAAGRQIEGRVVATRNDNDVDLGIVVINHPATIGAYEIGDKSPPSKQEIVMEGFGSEWSSKYKRTESKGQLSATQFEIDAMARQGDSGGAVLWGNRLSGVLVGNVGAPYLPGQRPAAATNGRAINIEIAREFLLKHLGELPRIKSEVPPPADDPAPVPKPVPVPPEDTTTVDRIRALEARIAELEKRKPERGPQGETGPRGEVGAKGDAGPAGKPADESKLTAIEARLKAIEAAELPVEIYDVSGSLKSRKLLRIMKGDPLRLQIESQESTRTVRE